ncbi:MAG: RagB/SusD family nutrient uptake outer membrane protein [Bacteroidales bacterium]|nr:RagB/SusD family nutrient uptake outer membrane protein [Bacteroidales bacterium]
MKTIRIIAVCAIALLSLSSCKKSFLDVKPTDKITADVLFASDAGVKAFVANLYYQMPVEDFAYDPMNGFHYNKVNPNNSACSNWITTDDGIGSQRGDMGAYEWHAWWTEGYKLNNDINQYFGYIEGLDKTEAEKDAMRGEAWFIRGMTYFALARRYGGVPIIDKVGDVNDSTTIYVPRSTEVKTWDYVIDCFAKADTLLGDGDGTGRRASKWVALAYKSRAALHAATTAKYWDKAPLSGEAVDLGYVGGFSAADADRYFDICIDACQRIIDSKQYELYGNLSPASKEVAIDQISKFFTDPASYKESIFIKGYSKVGEDYGTNQDNWGNPAQTAGAWPHPGRIQISLDWVESLENVSGNPEKRFITYDGDNFARGKFDKSRNYKHFADPMELFADKDARLEAYAILPGSMWKNTKIVIQGGLILPDGTAKIGVNLKIAEAVEKNGQKYYYYGAPEQGLFSGFSINGGNNNRTGFSLRKYLQPSYEAPGAAWNQSTTDWCDMRYSEVLLNYAEAVAETGRGDAALAVKGLNDIRHRAFLPGDVDLTVANVRAERRSEFLFENTRNWDHMRWRTMTDLNTYQRGALVPVLDLRTDPPTYIFVREFVRKADDTWSGGTGITAKRYYKSIPGTTGNHLVQNPQW